MENKFNQFLAKYNGQFIEIVGPESPNQCFDLAVKWCVELGLPVNIFAGLMYAYQIWEPSTTIAGNNFDYILNTPDAIAQVGDLVVWGQSYGPAGHVAICTTISDINHFQAFSQNDPIGSPSILKDYNYNHVLGFLRYKGQVTAPVDDCPAKLAEKTRLETELRGVITQKDETIAHLGDTISAKNAELANMNTMIGSLNEQVLTLQQSLAVATEQAKKVPQLTEDLANCEASRTGCQKDLSSCKTQVGKIKSQLVPKKYFSLKLYNLIMSLE